MTPLEAKQAEDGAYNSKHLYDNAGDLGGRVQDCFVIGLVTVFKASNIAEFLFLEPWD